MKKVFRVFSLLLFTVMVLSAGGCSNDGQKTKVEYKDTYKKFSPYDLWTVRQLRLEYDKAKKHSSLRKEILQKRIVLQGLISRVFEGGFLTKSYLQIEYNDQSDLVADFLFDGITYRVNCYFSKPEDMLFEDIGMFEIDGWLIVEGRINGDDELVACKVIAAFNREKRLELGLK